MGASTPTPLLRMRRKSPWPLFHRAKAPSHKRLTSLNPHSSFPNPCTQRGFLTLSSSPHPLLCLSRNDALWPPSSKAPILWACPFLERLADRLSLRTNSKPPGEYDAYSHMHNFYLRSTSKKKSVKQERAWELLYFLLLCEFKDFRHHEEVKQVAKIWRKLIFLPEELVADSFLRKVIFVLIFGLAQVDPQLEDHMVLKLKMSALK